MSALRSTRRDKDARRHSADTRTQTDTRRTQGHKRRSVVVGVSEVGVAAEVVDEAGVTMAGEGMGFFHTIV